MKSRIGTFTVAAMCLAALLCAVGLASGGEGRDTGRGGDVEDRVRPPAIKTGMMFRADEHHSGIYATGGLRALKGCKWQFKSGGRIHSTPAFSGTTLYVGSEDGNMYALDSSTGKEKWRFSSVGGVVSSPAVMNGLVYFGSHDNRCYALEADTGKKVWEYETGGWVESSPLVYDGIVYVGSCDNHCYALDARSGKLKWKFETENWVFSSPVLAGDTVVFGSFDFHIYAVDRTTGKEAWRSRTGGGIYSSPAVSGTVVYVGSDDGRLYALDSRTGKNLWTHTINGRIWTSPAVVGDMVYFGGWNGYVYAVNSRWKTGIRGLYARLFKQQGVVWKYDLGGCVLSSPAVSENCLYVGADHSGIFTFDRMTGKKLWQYEIQKVIGAAPACWGGMVFFGDWDGNVYALH